MFDVLLGYPSLKKSRMRRNIGINCLTQTKSRRFAVRKEKTRGKLCTTKRMNLAITAKPSRNKNESKSPIIGSVCFPGA